MVKLTAPLSRLSKYKILVAGDFMLDGYTIGKARRISPEAPVPVVHVIEEKQLPGGAGNVVLNLLALSADVVALGRIGDDPAGKEIAYAISQKGASIQGIIQQKGYRTPIKNRIIADGQQIARVDHEKIEPLTDEVRSTILCMIDDLMDDVKLVALSDYGKGFLSDDMIRMLIQEARKRGIISIADPKGHDFSRYEGVDIIKPNLSEAYTAAGLPLTASLEQVAERIFEKTKAKFILLTRSCDGITIFSNEGERFDFPVKARQVKDVTGAGDTVLAIVAMVLVNGLGIHVAAALANVGASCAIEEFGCAQVSVGQLACRLAILDPLNKIFDDEHLFVVKEALKEKEVGFLSISAKYGLSTKTYQAIAEMGKRYPDALVVGICDAEGDEEFIHLIASLREVSFVILEEHLQKTIIDEICPLEQVSLIGIEQ